MKKVLLYAYSLDGGGAEKVCQLLANRFSEDENFEVYLLLIVKSGVYLKSLNKNVEVISAPQFLARNNAFNIFYLWMKVWMLKIDCVISFAEWPNLYSGLAKFFSSKSVKFIFSEQNTKTFINQPEAYHISPLIQRLSIRSYNSADAIVCCSNRVLEEVNKVVSSECNSVIYNPVDFNYAQMMAKENVQIDFSKDKKNLVAIGRFHPQKDYITMLDAFELAYETNPDIMLYILGDGELRGEIEDRISTLQSRHSIKLLGFVDNPFSYLDKADALLHSAIFEGFGNIFIEALATGTPIITTNCDTPNEIIDHTLQGRVVPVKDAQALAIAILDQPKKTPEIIASCKERAQFFDIKNCFEQYKKIVQE